MFLSWPLTRVFVLAWFKKPKKKNPGEGCTVDQSVGEAAARAGRVEVLDWVWRNYGSSVEWREPKICVEAAKSGNIDTFK